MTGRRGSHKRVRSTLFTRIEARLPEIEQETLTRVKAIADPTDVADPAYIDGLRTAVVASLDYGLAGIEQGGNGVQSIPEPLLAQARLAARVGVGLDTVLRRYFAGYTFFGDVLIEEARVSPAPGQALRDLSRKQAMLFDRVVAAVTEEFTRETGKQAHTSEQRRVRRIEQLLAGDLLDTSDLAYDFDVWHLGGIAAGSDAEPAARELLRGLDCLALLVRRCENVIWLWFGARWPLDSAALVDSAQRLELSNFHISFGEPGGKLAGWRLTHRQASAALSVAKRTSTKAVRYSDVALLASILHDDVLGPSLREIYLNPLATEREDGERLRQTLRAYFDAGRNVSSTAAVLGVTRHTVAKRLRAVEERIGRSIESCSAELDAALQMDTLCGLKPGH